jgi:hypothetical protein
LGRNTDEIVAARFYGYTEQSDDSYVTTEFVALWRSPVWPVASWKIARSVQSSSNHENEKLPIQSGQAFQGWLVLFAVVGGLCFIAALLYAASKFDWSE